MRKLFLSAFLLAVLSVFAQSQTVGLFTYEEGSFNGYTLLAPMRYNSTFLVDNCGKVVNQWDHASNPGNSAYLLENGNLLRTAGYGVPSNPVFATGGGSNAVQEIDWDGNVVWEFEYSSDTYRMHHDAAYISNGNVLLVAWELIDSLSALAAGRDPNLLSDGVIWSEKVIEIAPDGMGGAEIVWEWHLWDHLVQELDDTKANYGIVSEHPELLNLNAVGGAQTGEKNWIHTNAIDYNETLDQILLSFHRLGEFVIIDHSTTTAEAATHSGGNSDKGGDILYRWGNPIVYGRGDSVDRKLYSQHNVHWVAPDRPDAGRIMIFNNGENRPEGDYTSIELIEPATNGEGQYTISDGQAFEPAESEILYQAATPTDFYARFLSGAEQLENGNLLICHGPTGRITEIDENDNIVWDYVNPATTTGILAQGDDLPPGPNGSFGNLMFRANRYAADYPGLQGKDLTPGEPVELNPLPSACEIIISIDELELSPISFYPNPVGNTVYFITEFQLMSANIFDISGQLIINNIPVIENRISIDALETGMYFITVEGRDGVHRQAKLWKE